MESSPTFEAIRSRVSARKFSQQEISDKLVLHLLDIANRAPSGFNLQPWHFVILRSPEMKPFLHQVALKQSQVVEAPRVVAFVANPNCYKDWKKKVLGESLSLGMISERGARAWDKDVKHLFRTGPFGLAGIAKRLILPFKRASRPTAQTLTSKKEVKNYVREQTMLAASTFMIAASGAGLATCPMEGFDEYRLKKLLAVPKSMSIPLLVAVGYPLGDGTATDSVRIPIEQKVSIDIFTNKIGSELD